MASQTNNWRPIEKFESANSQRELQKTLLQLSSLSLFICLCNNQVLFLTNESAKDEECLHSIRIRSKPLLLRVTAGL